MHLTQEAEEREAGFMSPGDTQKQVRLPLVRKQRGGGEVLKT